MYMYIYIYMCVCHIHPPNLKSGCKANPIAPRQCPSDSEPTDGQLHDIHLIFGPSLRLARPSQGTRIQKHAVDT